MKNSSMKQAPKGRMPAIMVQTTGCMYHTCVGTCLGIWLVLTGCSYGCFLYPKKYPRNTRGREIPNHMATIPMIVTKGMAPLECLPQMKRLMKNPIPKTTDG